MLRVGIGRRPKTVAPAANEVTARGKTAKVGARTPAKVAEVPSWRELGASDLTNTVRRITTLCGWTQVPEASGKTLAITSALGGEGKSSIAAALAITTARDFAAGVLLIECDLLQPSLAADFDMDEAPGLADVLSGEEQLDRCVRSTAITNLSLIPAGSFPDNASRLLRSAAMDELLRTVRSRFGFIVLDLPAVLTSSDAPVLAHHADGAVVIVRAGSTDQRAVQRTIDLLDGVNVHGMVLNRWRSRVPNLIRRVVDN
jgi:capsular exopolysaccharide synthesis family protein